MKKLLYFAGLVMAAAVVWVLQSCSGKSPSSTGSAGDETVEITIMDGHYTVNRYTAETYSGIQQIRGALMREQNLEGVAQPTDASTFGKKTAEFEWKAFKNPTKDKNDRSVLDKTPVSAGTVKVIHYEKGIEVVKDGKSWFYDAAHLYSANNIGDTPEEIFTFWAQKERQDPKISASESILHPGVWEPVVVSFSNILDDEINFHPMYGQSDATILTPENLAIRNDSQVKKAKELVVSQKLY